MVYSKENIESLLNDKECLLKEINESKGFILKLIKNKLDKDWVIKNLNNNLIDYLIENYDLTEGERVYVSSFVSDDNKNKILNYSKEDCLNNDIKLNCDVLFTAEEINKYKNKIAKQYDISGFNIETIIKNSIKNMDYKEFSKIDKDFISDNSYVLTVRKDFFEIEDYKKLYTKIMFEIYDKPRISSFKHYVFNKNEKKLIVKLMENEKDFYDSIRWNEFEKIKGASDIVTKFEFFKYCNYWDLTLFDKKELEEDLILKIKDVLLPNIKKNKWSYSFVNSLLKIKADIDIFEKIITKEEIKKILDDVRFVDHSSEYGNMDKEKFLHILLCIESIFCENFKMYNNKIDINILYKEIKTLGIKNNLKYEEQHKINRHLLINNVLKDLKNKKNQINKDVIKATILNNEDVEYVLERSGKINSAITIKLLLDDMDKNNAFSSNFKIIKAGIENIYKIKNNEIKQNELFVLEKILSKYDFFNDISEIIKDIKKHSEGKLYLTVKKNKSNYYVYEKNNPKINYKYSNEIYKIRPDFLNYVIEKGLKINEDLLKNLLLDDREQLEIENFLIKYIKNNNKTLSQEVLKLLKIHKNQKVLLPVDIKEDEENFKYIYKKIKKYEKNSNNFFYSDKELRSFIKNNPISTEYAKILEEKLVKNKNWKKFELVGCVFNVFEKSDEFKKYVGGVSYKELLDNLEDEAFLKIINDYNKKNKFDYNQDKNDDKICFFNKNYTKDEYNELMALIAKKYDGNNEMIQFLRGVEDKDIVKNFLIKNYPEKLINEYVFVIGGEYIKSYTSEDIKTIYENVKLKYNTYLCTVGINEHYYGLIGDWIFYEYKKNESNLLSYSNKVEYFKNSDPFLYVLFIISSVGNLSNCVKSKKTKDENEHDIFLKDLEVDLVIKGVEYIKNELFKLTNDNSKKHSLSRVIDEYLGMINKILWCSYFEVSENFNYVKKSNMSDSDTIKIMNYYANNFLYMLMINGRVGNFDFFEYSKENMYNWISKEFVDNVLYSGIEPYQKVPEYRKEKIENWLIDFVLQLEKKDTLLLKYFIYGWEKYKFNNNGYSSIMDFGQTSDKLKNTINILKVKINLDENLMIESFKKDVIKKI